MTDTSGYLPPVVIRAVGDDRDALDMIAEVKAALADLAKSRTTVTVEGDAKPLDEVLAEASGELRAFGEEVATSTLSADEKPLLGALIEAQTALGDFARQVAQARLGADAAPFWAEIAELRALLGADPATLRVDADVAPAIAEIEALRGALSLAKTGSLLDAIAGGKGYGSGLAGFAAGTAAGDAEKAGRDAATLFDAGFATTLGWHGGGLWSLLAAPLTLFSGGFGSLASLAGFGPEHLLTTGLGLAGSLVGGLGGGALLGLSSLGVEGVGLGTDLAGMGQAVGDIQNVSKAASNLSSVIDEYGKKSQEAAVAQSELNQALTGFNPVARDAVVQASNTVDAFKSMFDEFTGYAEASGARIITGLVDVAETFLPEIGKFALENTDIIQRALLPLEEWIEGPGRQIFTELEEKFQRDLPFAMGAFDNGIELVIKTIGYLSGQTGGLTKHLDDFFTRMNGPEWGKWIGEVQKLVDLWHVWGSFAKILVEDIADIFGKGVGLGSGIIKELTGYLDQLHTALQGSGGGDNLSKLFVQHKAEFLELITVIVQLGRSFTDMYLIAAPFLTMIFTDLLKIIDAALRLVTAIPDGADILGLLLIFSRIKLLSPLFNTFFRFVGSGFVALGRLIEQAFIAVLARILPANILAMVTTGGAAGAAADTLPEGAFGVEAAAGGAAGAGLLGTLGSLATALPVVGELLLGASLAFKILTTNAAPTAKALDAATKGALGLNASNSLPALQANLSAVTRQLQGTAQPTAEFAVKIGDAGQQSLTAASKVALLKAKMQDQSEVTTFSRNLTFLAIKIGQTTGVTTQLADSLGIKLYKSLNFDAVATRMQAYLGTLDSAAQTTTSGLEQMASASGESLPQTAASIKSFSAEASASMNQFTQQLATGSTATAIQKWYQTQLQTMQNFGRNIQKAIADGYSPSYIASILAQGPTAAAPQLAALVNESSSTIVRMISSTQQKLQAQGQAVANEMTIELQGVKAKGTAMGNALPEALALARASTSSNVAAQLAAVINEYKLTLPQVELISGEYATSLSKAAKGLVAATGEAGGNLGLAFDQGLAAGIYANATVATTAAAATTYAVGKAGHGGLRAQSPSQTMWDLGLYAMQGLALGITSNAALPITAMINVVKKLDKIPITLGGPGSFMVGTPMVGGIGGSHPGISITASFTILAPGGNAGAILNAIEHDAAEILAAQTLKSLKAGAGTSW